MRTKRNAMVALACAGIAASANAQQFSLSIVPAFTSFASGPMTVDIYGDASVGTHMLGGAFGLQIDTLCGADISNITWRNAEWSAFNSDSGYSGGGAYDQVIFGQLVLPDQPPFDVPASGSELGMRIGSFVIEFDDSGEFPGMYGLRLVAQDPFSLEVIDIDTGETFSSAQGELVLNGATVVGTLCPSPSSCALLGLAGLGAARRRR